MNNLKHYITFLLIGSLLFYCKERVVESNDEPATIKIVKGAAYANSQNALQAVYSEKGKSAVGYFYGSFDASGSPDSLRQLVVQRPGNDSILHIAFNKNQLVESAYYSVKGVRDSTLITFEYGVPGKIVVKAYNFNASSGFTKLRAEVLVNNSSQNVKAEKVTHYASIIGVFAGVLSTSDTPDWFSFQFISAQAGVAVANLALVAATTALGCTVGGVGCVFGGVVGLFIILNKSNAEELKSVPKGAPLPTTSYPVVKTINLVNGAGKDAYFPVVNIPFKDSSNYVLAFDGFWKHYILGVQNSVGNILEPGRIPGNIRILISVYSNVTGQRVRDEFYNGNPVTITEKGVSVIISPRDVNSQARFPDGHIPAEDMSSIAGRAPMFVVYIKKR